MAPGGRRRLGNVDTAIEHYRLATALEPQNALVRLRLGNLLETKGDVLGAVEQYLTISLHWPDLVVPSYRVGAAYAAHKRLVAAWEKAGNQKRRVLERLIHAVESESLPRNHDKSVSMSRLPGYFLDRSLAHWNDLSYTDGGRDEDIRRRSFRRLRALQRALPAFNDGWRRVLDRVRSNSTKSSRLSLASPSMNGVGALTG